MFTLKYTVMDWMLVSTQNPYVEALISQMTVFRDSACEEVIKVKWGHKNRALIQ